MRVLLGLGLVVILLVLATSRRLWSMRSRPLIAVLSAGGWLSFFLGAVLGPQGMVVLREQDLYTLNHIAFFCLGWTGLTIGLQARRSIVSLLPREMTLVVLADTALSLAVVGAASFVLLAVFLVPDDLRTALFISLLIGICSVGWLGEMRSLRMSGLVGQGRLRQFLAGTSGLSSITAVTAFGMLLEFFAVGAPQLTGWSRPGGPLVGFLVTFGLAVLIGVLAKYLLRLAQKRRSDYLVVLFGLVALPAAAAVVLGFSPMFVSMLSGAAIGTIAQYESLRLQTLLLEGERLIATALMLIAGMVADLRIALPGILLVACALLARAGVKWLIITWRVPAPATRWGRYAGAVRQSYLAPVFMLSLCSIVETPMLPLPVLPEKLLTVVTLIGIFSHLLPALATLGAATRAKEGA